MKYFTSAWNNDIKNFVARDPSEITIRFICGGDMGRVHIFYDELVKPSMLDQKARGERGMTSPVPWILISFLAALIVFAGAVLDPVVGAGAAFVFIWGILERERQEVYKKSEVNKE